METLPYNVQCYGMIEFERALEKIYGLTDVSITLSNDSKDEKGFRYTFDKYSFKDNHTTTDTFSQHLPYFILKFRKNGKSYGMKFEQQEVSDFEKRTTQEAGTTFIFFRHPRIQEERFYFNKRKFIDYISTKLKGFTCSKAFLEEVYGHRVTEEERRFMI